MEDSLYHKIIGQLACLDYSGRLVLSLNNEPFLDKRIIDFAMIARESLPKAYIYLWTNGTFLNVENFKRIMQYLDFIYIDNYNDDLELNPPIKKIYMFCRKNQQQYKSKVKIYIRKETQVLSSRAGQAKNKRIDKPPIYSCMQPYNYLAIRPDGKVSLCCSDALGEMTMGDLTQKTLVEVWNSKKFNEIRKRLIFGRSKIPLCSQCDFL